MSLFTKALGDRLWRTQDMLRNSLNMEIFDTVPVGMATLVEYIQLEGIGPGGTPPKVLIVAPVRLADEPCPFPFKFDGAVPKSQSLAGLYQQVAELLGTAFLDASLHATCPSPDSIHLDAVGHASLGEAIAAKVTSLFP